MVKQSFLGITMTAAMLFTAMNSGLAIDIPAVVDLGVSSSEALRIIGESSGNNTGLSVAAGDIDGDGCSDVVVGALNADPNGRSNAGTVYIVFGGADARSGGKLDLRATSPRVLKLIGPRSGVNLGQSVKTGDVNGDGYDDIIAGANGASLADRPNAGEVYVIFGSRELRDKDYIDLASPWLNVLCIIGEQEYIASENSPDARSAAPGGQLGISVAAGDINGDGFSDIVMGAWRASPEGRSSAGKVYVLFGSKELSSRGCIDLQQTSSGTLVINGRAPGDCLGFGVGAGDMNGDGYDEILAGAWFARSNSGEVNIIMGSADIASGGSVDLSLNQPGVVKVIGARESDFTGAVISTGDVDGDGITDMLACAHGGDTPGGSNAGKVYVVFGSRDFASKETMYLSARRTDVLCIMGEHAEDHVGRSGTGDFNGDGIDDLVIQANSDDINGKSDSGSAYVIYGSPSLRDMGSIDLRSGSPVMIRILGEGYNDNCGMFSASGDVDGDGRVDLILGANGASFEDRSMCGKAYVIWNTFGEITPGPYGRFRFLPNTGNNSTVLFLAANPPSINGQPIAKGDEIGVFTPGNICAGAGVWTGENLAITIWGDNSLQDGIEGFLEGERYSFRIWDASAKRIYSSEARFSQGNPYYTADGISIVDRIEGASAKFKIILAPGWNLISAPVIPDDPLMNSLFGTFGDDFVLAKNGKGEVFWPKYGINTILRWQPASGYQVYMDQAGELAVSGQEISPSDAVYNLPRDWSLISFTGPEGISPADAFQSLGSKLTIIKDGAGNVFWPGMNIDQIGALNRGKAYWIYLSSAASFSYPPTIPHQEKAGTSKVAAAYFSPIAGTGNNATLLIKADSETVVNGRRLIAGDQIGVFDPSGICVGAGVWAEGAHLAITVWGDNEMTTVREGILPGEQYRFVIVDTETGETYPAEAEFIQGTPEYTVNGIAILRSLRAGLITGVSDAPKSFSLNQNVPNPFNPSTAISFTLPRSAQVTVTVYNAAGAKVAELANGIFSAGSHSIVWNAEGCGAGVYFCHMKSGSFVDTRKMLLMK